MFPSQVPFPLLLTVPGIEAVSISSTLFKIPSCVRNPTMILGTPRRKDCIQNFISLRSKVIISLSFRISALVLSSTQLIGLSSDGFESHTDSPSVASTELERCSYLHRPPHRESSQCCLFRSSRWSNIEHGCLRFHSLDSRCILVEFRPRWKGVSTMSRICSLLNC